QVSRHERPVQDETDTKPYEYGRQSIPLSQQLQLHVADNVDLNVANVQLMMTNKL
ncbi:unnamed protein product, partial [Didymodactylos carnosus]